MAYCLQEKYEQQPFASHRRDVEEYLRFNIGNERDEYITALYLDNKNHVVGTEIVSEGTVNQCALYPRAVIENALRYGATAFLLAHNHPGGGLEPSEADWNITTRLFQIGQLMDIPLLDHIIVSKRNTVSLKSLARWPKNSA
jgi:DNA repair protein RadC